MVIKLINGDAKDFNFSADLICTDPPFEMSGKELAQIIEQYDSHHLLMLCSMHQLLDFYKHTEFKLNWDGVIDLVAPKQSKSLHQPNYIHANLVYMTRGRVKTRFNRKHGERSDVFTQGYFPSIIRANRERSQEHGHAKNQQAIQDVLSYFDFESIVDMFAGSGTTGIACLDLQTRIKNITLIEKNKANFDNMVQTFKFLGAEIL